jgi:hypothetical protein
VLARPRSSSALRTTHRTTCATHPPMLATGHRVRVEPCPSNADASRPSRHHAAERERSPDLPSVGDHGQPSAQTPSITDTGNGGQGLSGRHPGGGGPSRGCERPTLPCGFSLRCGRGVDLLGVLPAHVLAVAPAATSGGVCVVVVGSCCRSGVALGCSLVGVADAHGGAVSRVGSVGSFQQGAAVGAGSPCSAQRSDLHFYYYSTDLGCPVGRGCVGSFQLPTIRGGGRSCRPRFTGHVGVAVAGDPAQCRARGRVASSMVASWRSPLAVACIASRRVRRPVSGRLALAGDGAGHAVERALALAVA